jgi:nucleotide-binding universal stress UspA family protein
MNSLLRSSTSFVTWTFRLRFRFINSQLITRSRWRKLKELPLAVTEAAARLSGTPHETDVLIESGDPAQEIIEHAESGQFDAVYIGGRKDSPVGKVLFGSVVQAVLLNTDTPVTVVGQLE